MVYVTFVEIVWIGYYVVHVCQCVGKRLSKYILSLLYGKSFNLNIYMNAVRAIFHAIKSINLTREENEMQIPQQTLGGHQYQCRMKSVSSWLS